MTLISVEHHANEIALKGVLTFSTSLEALELALTFLPSEGELEINLKGITRSDSSGLALLCELMREARARHLKLSFKGIPSHIHDLIRVSGLDSVLFET